MEYHKEGAIFAFSIQEMWDIIAQIMHDEKFRQSILERQNALKPLLLPATSMSLSQLIRRTIKDPKTLLHFPMRGTMLLKNAGKAEYQMSI
jgi:hypothetical protein